MVGATWAERPNGGGRQGSAPVGEPFGGTRGSVQLHTPAVVGRGPTSATSLVKIRLFFVRCRSIVEQIRTISDQIEGFFQGFVTAAVAGCEVVVQNNLLCA